MSNIDKEIKDELISTMESHLEVITKKSNEIANQSKDLLVRSKTNNIKLLASDSIKLLNALKSI